MVCSHCGKVLDNDKLAFCVYCGYPLKGSQKGFFAKSEETGTSAAEDYARAEAAHQAAQEAQPAPQPKPAPVPQPAPAPQSAPVQSPVMNPAPQPAVPNVPQMGVVQPMMTGAAVPHTGAQSMMPGVPAMGAQPVMQGAMPQMMGMPPMQPQQNMQGVEMPMMPQMPYGMPQMPYGMPQMQYGMPQFAGYDAQGNPVYMQMMPQLVGYDAYGNPLYNMVAMPYIMPGMQGMPAMQPMQQAVPPMYQTEPVIDVPQEQIRPAETIPQAAPVMPMQEAAPVQQPIPSLQQPAAPVQQMQQPIPAAPVQQPVPETPLQQMQQPIPAASVQQPVPEAPVQQDVPKMHEMLTERKVEISSEEDIPMDAEALVNEGEPSRKQEVPSEEEILNSIFSDAPKTYTMSEGVKPAAATFSINVSASEIISVRDDDIAPPPLPPVPTLKAEKPKKAAAPVKGMTEQEAHELKAAAKREREEKAAAAKREKEAKAAAAKKEKEKATKKKQAPKKAPATIVSPEDFFNDNKKTRRDTLSVRELEALDDEQLAAHLHSMQSANGGKKSTRSMKAASRDEMDVSNIEADALLGLNGGLPH